MGGKKVEDCSDTKQSKSYYRHRWDWKFSLDQHLSSTDFRLFAFIQSSIKLTKNHSEIKTKSHIEGKLNFPCVLFLMWEIFSSFFSVSRSVHENFYILLFFFVEQSNFFFERREFFLLVPKLYNVEFFFSVAMALTPWTTREREWVVCVYISRNWIKKTKSSRVEEKLCIFTI